MLPIVAGIVSALISKGLPGVAKVVTEKGVEYAQEKLGVELKPDMTEEDAQKISEAATKHEEFLLTKVFEDVADARDMQTKIEESEHASSLAKNTAYILDFVIVGATIILTVLILFTTIPSANKELVFTMLGSLLTYSGVIINFHRGTSAGSVRKTDMLNRIGK